MPDVLSSPVLVLNRYFQPVQLTSVRRAVVLLYGGAAQAVDEHGEVYDFDRWRLVPAMRDGDVLPLVAGAMRVPRVVHLLRYERVPRAAVRLSRENLMLRDDYQCQYCGKRPGVRELNIDHVLPKSRGGGDAWENLVTSCKSCNVRKGWRTPDEAAMRLARKPFQPKWSYVSQMMQNASMRFPEWDPYVKTS